MSINIRMPKIEKLLEVKDVNIIPKTGGVYFLCDNDTVLYIGRTNNLKNRVTNHVKGKTNTKSFHEIITFIAYFETDDITEQEIYESHAIKIFNPPFNKDKKNNSTIKNMLKEKLETTISAVSDEYRDRSNEIIRLRQQGRLPLIEFKIRDHYFHGEWKILRGVITDFLSDFVWIEIEDGMALDKNHFNYPNEKINCKIIDSYSSTGEIDYIALREFNKGKY